uniref:Uncharacterized protein n=1 Tax=Solanum tuberosum TaxID=4113 RepID=M1DV15_SOLTU
MAKSSLPSSTVTRKSSRNKNKGKTSSAIFIDFEYSDDLIPPVSVASSLDKTLVHIRVVDLDILSSLDCHIKNLFEFQGWADIFYVPMVVYEPLFACFMLIFALQKLEKLNL